MSDERGFMKYLPLVGAAILLVVGIAQFFAKRRKPRSFREDPIGALKDRSELVAERAHEASEEALARLQESIDEIRARMPEFSRKRVDKRRKEYANRLTALGDQAQTLLKELRANNVFSR
jgi:hypothetical protein